MKNIIKYTAFLLVLSGIAASCNPDPVPPPEPPIIEYPIETPFEEYSLLETSCQWANLPYDEKMIVINSNEDLEDYIACTEGTYPTVDFSKYSLLLVSGKTDNSICDFVAKGLQQLSENSYKLDIELLLNNITISAEWCMALVVNKITESNSFEINVNYTDSGYPIDIAIEEYAFVGEACGHNTSVTIINSAEELENYIASYPTYCNCPSYVDFSQHTLLLVNGYSMQGFSGVINVSLIQNCTNEYELNVIYYTGSIPEGWTVSVVTSKISYDAHFLINEFYQH